ncbi:hypothetical protein MAR_031490 [Mya arenaria]|nr:hypothetical protein MAR_031490 [Mya arenaria]
MTLADDLNVYAQKWADNLAARDTMEHSNCKLPSGGSVTSPRLFGKAPPSWAWPGLRLRADPSTSWPLTGQRET